MPERPNMWYIFEKRIVQGYQKLYSHLSNAQIQKIQIPITQIQHMTECQKDPTCGTFFKRGLFKDFIPMCQTHKYENIQKRWQTVKLSNRIMEYWTERGHNNAINVTLHPPVTFGGTVNQ